MWPCTGAGAGVTCKVVIKCDFQRLRACQALDRGSKCIAVHSILIIHRSFLRLKGPVRSKHFPICCCSSQLSGAQIAKPCVHLTSQLQRCCLSKLEHAEDSEEQCMPACCTMASRAPQKLAELTPHQLNLRSRPPEQQPAEAPHSISAVLINNSMITFDQRSLTSNLHPEIP